MCECEYPPTGHHLRLISLQKPLEETCWRVLVYICILFRFLQQIIKSPEFIMKVDTHLFVEDFMVIRECTRCCFTQHRNTTNGLRATLLGQPQHHQPLHRPAKNTDHLERCNSPSHICIYHYNISGPSSGLSTSLGTSRKEPHGSTK